LLPLTLPLDLTLLSMVRWASCPPCGRLSERWWTMRGLEAHATKNPPQPRPSRDSGCPLSLNLPRSPSLVLRDARGGASHR
jgi:hypothetical protein